jgi:hypothetical protein
MLLVVDAAASAGSGDREQGPRCISARWASATTGGPASLAVGFGVALVEEEHRSGARPQAHRDD